MSKRSAKRYEWTKSERREVVETTKNLVDEMTGEEMDEMINYLLGRPEHTKAMLQRERVESVSHMVAKDELKHTIEVLRELGFVLTPIAKPGTPVH